MLWKFVMGGDRTMRSEEHGATVREAGVREEMAALEAHRVARKMAERNMMRTLWRFGNSLHVSLVAFM